MNADLDKGELSVVNTPFGPVKFIPIEELGKYLEAQLIENEMVRIPEMRPFVGAWFSQDEMPSVTDLPGYKDHVLVPVRSTITRFIGDEFKAQCIDGVRSYPDIIEACHDESERQYSDHYAQPSLAVCFDENSFAIIDPEHFKIFGFNDPYGVPKARVVPLRTKVRLLKVVPQVMGQRLLLPRPKD